MEAGDDVYIWNFCEGFEIEALDCVKTLMVPGHAGFAGGSSLFMVRFLIYILGGEGFGFDVYMILGPVGVLEVGK